MSTITVSTTHNIGLDFEAAPLTARMLAAIIDYALLIGIIVIWAVRITSLEPDGDEVVLYMVYLLLLLVLLLAPFLQESMLDGQTIGKKIMRIRVMKLDGSAPTVGDYFIRWLTGIIEVMGTSGLVAMTSYIVTRDHQRLGDIAAGTVVIRMPRPVTVASLRVASTPDREIMFPSVRLLTDADIQIIREVLHGRATGLDAATTDLLIAKTADAVAAKLHATHEMDPRSFLLRVLADHTHVHNS
ncbi:MAG: RDD family protein [Ignavibacteriae bacterium]|nr:MAG: RDD family protein [Ignavibacteriota bacterium]